MSDVGEWRVMGAVFVGAYWGDRRSSQAESVDVLAPLLKRFSLDDRFVAWFPKGVSARTGQPITVESLGKVFRANRRDTDRSVIEELGLSFGLWNGDSSFGAV